MPTKVSWRCQLWSWQETAHTSDWWLSKTLIWSPDTPYGHIYDIMWAWSVLWVWGAADLWVTQASLPNQIPSCSSYYYLWLCLSPPCVLLEQRRSLFWEHSICCRPFSLTRPHMYVGCSKSYSLDAYSQKEIKGINFQVNNQANLGLQKIRGH